MCKVPAASRNEVRTLTRHSEEGMGLELGGGVGGEEKEGRDFR